MKIKFIGIVFCIIAIVSGMPAYDHYYVNVPCEDHSAKALVDMIGNSKFTIPYEFCKFDCSEMSAYLEWFLVSHGFKTKMCVNTSTVDEFGKIKPGHVWLLVEVTGREGNETVYVEPTSVPIRIYEKGMLNYTNYEHPKKIFDNVFSAVNDIVLESEVDWWKNVSDIPKGLTMTTRVNGSYVVVSKSEFPDISV